MDAYASLQFFHDILLSFPYSIQYEELTEWIRQYTSSEVEECLFVHFEDEPYEDFNTTPILEDIIRMYCNSYALGRLDPTVPDLEAYLKELYDDLKDLIANLRVDIVYLQRLCEDYERILKDHGLLLQPESHIFHGR